jgi:hypothetical protein
MLIILAEYMMVVLAVTLNKTLSNWLVILVYKVLFLLLSLLLLELVLVNLIILLVRLMFPKHALQIKTPL